MRLVIDLALGFLTIGFIEAVIKPIAKRFVQRRILRVAPAVFELLDRQMPQLVTQLDGAQLTAIVRHKLESLTGESWSSPEIETIFSLYDPRVTADKLQSANRQ